MDLPAFAGRWCANTPQIVSELVDGEVILIHLEKGLYFSLRGSGPLLWTLLSTGSSIDQIVKVLESRYPEQLQLSEMVAALAGRLLAEELLRPGDASVNDQPPGDLPWPQSFEAPLFECFSDLQSLILIDPIHEVGPQGWPATNS